MSSEMEVHQNEHATEVYSLKLAPVHIDTPAASPAPSSANPSPDCEDLNNEDSAEKQDGESEKSDIDDKSTSQHDDGDDGEDTGKKSHTIDPIRWFGILVPQALRDAQSSFTKAVDDPILRLASINAEMRSLERSIGDMRKSLEAKSSKSESFNIAVDSQ